MTTTAVHLSEIAAFWRSARRLYTIYSALDRTFEIGAPTCPDLEYPVDRSEPAAMDRVRQWFDHMDEEIQVWQLRQLLQSTNLQTEENLGDLVVRHLRRGQKNAVDRDKIDFLLVQYFAHCAPQGLYERPFALDEVARILEPVLGAAPDHFPDWVTGLDAKLEKLNQCNSLEELQNSGALVEVRELKLSSGDRYFDLPCLIAFTKFNFLARRAFFRAMHLDLHAIRNAINELQQRGCAAVDCSEAGLSDRESLEHIRHLVHQWKTPFRAPYSGGNSFLQLVQLRQALQQALDESGGKKGAGAKKEPGPAHASQAFEEILPGYTGLAPAAASNVPVPPEVAMETPRKEEPAVTAEVSSGPPSVMEFQLAVEAPPRPSASPAMQEFLVEAAPVLEEEVPESPAAAIGLQSRPGAQGAKPVPSGLASPPSTPGPSPQASASTPVAAPAPPKAEAPHKTEAPRKAPTPAPAAAAPAKPAPPPAVVAKQPPAAAPVAPPKIAAAAPVASIPATSIPVASPPGTRAARPLAEEEEFLEQCVADIRGQLVNAPPKAGPGVTPIVLAGCKLLIATWEADAFTKSPMNELTHVLQRAVAGRTILHVSLERSRKGEPTDLPAALQIGNLVVEEMKQQVAKAKQVKNIDAAVNLAATTKRLLGLLEEGAKLGG